MGDTLDFWSHARKGCRIGEGSNPGPLETEWCLATANITSWRKGRHDAVARQPHVLALQETMIDKRYQATAEADARAEGYNMFSGLPYLERGVSIPRVGFNTLLADRELDASPVVGLSKEQDELWRTGRYAHVLVNMGGVPLHVINLYCLKKGVHYRCVQKKRSRRINIVRCFPPSPRIQC